MKRATTVLAAVVSSVLAQSAFADAAPTSIEKQREALARNTEGKGFGPQTPRDIDSPTGNNQRVFSAAPPAEKMNLCNIHFHAPAEHKGGDFTTPASSDEGAGYKYDGKLSRAERKPLKEKVCTGNNSAGLQSGDTIELHYVHTTAQVEPGPTLGACLSDAIKNPQLRVETQVFVLVNDDDALDFNKLAERGVRNGYHQALNIPANTGTPIQFAGSTTGPSYNTEGSPLQVSWSVRPEVAKVDISTVGEWCKGNTFNEDHPHGVRNLVVNPDLLSEIE